MLAIRRNILTKIFSEHIVTLLLLSHLMYLL